MKTKIAFWLIPSAEDKAFFQKTINYLAQQYDAPAFTPHVTIYSGEYTPDESLDEIIEKAIQGVQNFSLSADKILYTNQFTKSLFLQFHQSSILSRISETIRSSSKKPSNFALNPHLSLIYKDLSEPTKKNLTASLSMPKSKVLFDEVSAISTPERVQTREDVESWKVICIKKLK